MPVEPPKKLAIIGIGLLGASLGLALAGGNYKRIGWNRNSGTLKKALDMNVIDEAFEKIEDALAGADITVFCLPIPQIIEYALRYSKCFKPASLVTDIGSVKGRIVEALEDELAEQKVEFLGSHPMAGTEKNGLDAAFKELYEGATVFITPTAKSSSNAVSLITSLWTEAGAVSVTAINAAAHDSLVAHTSHVPHVVSMVLTQTVLGDEKTKTERYAGCAGGFRDTSRISSSSPVMWREIIENNPEAVLEGIRNFTTRLNLIKNIIEDKDYDTLQFEFSKSKKLRDEWIKHREKA
jgi:prephenate dehydrogenase